MTVITLSPPPGGYLVTKSRGQQELCFYWIDAGASATLLSGFLPAPHHPLISTASHSDFVNTLDSTPESVIIHSHRELKEL